MKSGIEHVDVLAWVVSQITLALHPGYTPLAGLRARAWQNYSIITAYPGYAGWLLASVGYGQYNNRLNDHSMES